MSRRRRRRLGRRVPVVLQATVTDCGPACLAMVLAHHGRGVPLDVLRDELGVGRDGLDALALRDGAERYGLRCRGLRADIATIRTLPVPFVVHWEGRHFVVVERVRRDAVDLIDPTLGRRRVSLSTFDAAFAGVALTFAPDGEPRGHAAPPRTWRTVLGPALHVRRSVLATLAATSALLLLAGLAVPLATAYVVNRLVANATIDSHGALGAVALLAVAVGALSFARGIAAATLQQHVGRELTGGLVDRLLGAPLAFVERRGSGEVTARLSATDVVRDALATQLVGAVLDTLVALSYVAILLVASPALGLTTLALGGAQLALLAALAVRGRRLRREELLAQVRVQGWLYGVVTGLGWVKAAGAERVMYDRWSDLHEQRLAALGRTARTGALAEAVTGALRLAGPLVVLLAAAALADGTGRIVGLAALATAALLPMGALAGHLQAFHEIGSVVEHLGDLAAAPAEQPGRKPEAPRLRGALRARGLGFRHTHRSPFALRHVDIDLAPGDKLGVVGPSGSGKSTLVKLLAGLYAPSEGEVRFDGRDLRELDLRSVRRRLGVVLQDPFLLAGTVAENIALRRPDATLGEVIAAAELAAVHDDIAALPLGYDTTLANGGAELSGGQAQRIALARALLDRPSVLILDEATSHLDTATEARIERNLRALGITRIVIAHRLSTVRDADQILVIQDGRVAESGTYAELARSGALGEPVAV
jgi:ATP-binding cassette subfamily B protein